MEAHATELEPALEFVVFKAEEGLDEFLFAPGILHALPEKLVVIFLVLAAEVVEHGRSAGEEARGGLIVDSLLPCAGSDDGIEHLGQVLHLLFVLAYAGGHGNDDVILSPRPSPREGS